MGEVPPHSLNLKCLNRPWLLRCMLLVLLRARKCSQNCKKRKWDEKIKLRWQVNLASTIAYNLKALTVLNQSKYFIHLEDRFKSVRYGELIGIDFPISEIRQHRLHAVCRCGPLLQMSICVSLCIGNNRERRKLCKNDWTDRYTVWDVDSCGHQEPRTVLDSGPDYPRKGARLRTDMIRRCEG